MAGRKTIQISDETYLRLVRFRDASEGWVKSFDEAIRLLLDRTKTKKKK